MERGVVALPFEVIPSAGGFSTGAWISAIQINYFSLYWDKICVPDNRMISSPLPNENDLESMGLLSRPMMEMRGAFHSDQFPKMYLESQIEIVDGLRDTDKYTAWSIHQYGESPLLLSNGSVSKETLRLELESLLPVPGTEVNLNEILEFKERRSDELAALHSYCDELYFEVINSGDPQLQAAKSFVGLRQVISDLNKLNAEGWRSPIKFDLDISPEFDLSSCRAGIATIIGAFSTPHVLETVTAGSAIAVLEGFVKLRPRVQSMRKGGNNNLAYLSKGKREGIYK